MSEYTYEVVGTSTESPVVVDVPAGESATYVIRAVSEAGVVSEWSDPLTYTATVDLDPPKQPSAPVLTSSMGQVTISWNGKNQDNSSPELDWAYIEVQEVGGEAVGTITSSMTSVVHTGLTRGTEHTYRFVSVDTSMNRSTPSASTTITVKSVLDDEETVEGIGELASGTDVTYATTPPVGSGNAPGDTWYQVSDGQLQTHPALTGWSGSSQRPQFGSPLYDINPAYRNISDTPSATPTGFGSAARWTTTLYYWNEIVSASGALSTSFERGLTYNYAAHAEEIVDRNEHFNGAVRSAATGWSRSGRAGSLARQTGLPTAMSNQSVTTGMRLSVTDTNTATAAVVATNAIGTSVVTAGTEYHFEVRSKGSVAGSTAAIRVEWYNSSSTLIGSAVNGSQQPVTTAWRPIFHRATAPSGAAFARLSVVSLGLPQNAYVDLTCAYIGNLSTFRFWFDGATVLNATYEPTGFGWIGTANASASKYTIPAYGSAGTSTADFLALYTQGSASPYVASVDGPTFTPAETGVVRTSLRRGGGSTSAPTAMKIELRKKVDAVTSALVLSRTVSGTATSGNWRFVSSDMLSTADYWTAPVGDTYFFRYILEFSTAQNAYLYPPDATFISTAGYTRAESDTGGSQAVPAGRIGAALTLPTPVQGGSITWAIDTTTNLPREGNVVVGQAYYQGVLRSQTQVKFGPTASVDQRAGFSIEFQFGPSAGAPVQPIDELRFYADINPSVETSAITLFGSQVFTDTSPGQQGASAQWNWNGTSWVPLVISQSAIGVISGTKILANTITSDKIQAGSIRAEHLAAGSIKADNIEVGALDGQVIRGGQFHTNQYDSGWKIYESTLELRTGSGRSPAYVNSGGKGWFQNVGIASYLRVGSTTYTGPEFNPPDTNDRPALEVYRAGTAGGVVNHTTVFRSPNFIFTDSGALETAAYLDVTRIKGATPPTGSTHGITNGVNIGAGSRNWSGVSGDGLTIGSNGAMVLRQPERPNDGFQYNPSGGLTFRPNESFCLAAGATSVIEANGWIDMRVGSSAGWTVRSNAVSRDTSGSLGLDATISATTIDINAGSNNRIYGTGTDFFFRKYASGYSGTLRAQFQANDSKVEMYVNPSANSNTGYFRVAGNTNETYAQSDAIYNKTASVTANVYIAGNGILGRVTSARKYKTEIESHAYSGDILMLEPRSWVDRAQADRIAEGVLYDGESSTPDRYVGLIAEEVLEAGFPELVTYGPDGEIEGLAYDRLAVALIPELKTLRDRVAELESRSA